MTYIGVSQEHIGITNLQWLLFVQQFVLVDNMYIYIYIKHKSSALLVLCEGNPLENFFLMLWSLQWCRNECDGVSNHQPHDCLLDCLFRLNKTSKLHITGLFEGNSPVTSEFPTQRASNTESVSIWWHRHVLSVSWWHPSWKPAISWIPGGCFDTLFLNCIHECDIAWLRIFGVNKMYFSV